MAEILKRLELDEEMTSEQALQVIREYSRNGHTQELWDFYWDKLDPAPPSWEEVRRKAAQVLINSDLEISGYEAYKLAFKLSKKDMFWVVLKYQGYDKAYQFFGAIPQNELWAEVCKLVPELKNRLKWIKNKSYGKSFRETENPDGSITLECYDGRSYGSTKGQTWWETRFSEDGYEILRGVMHLPNMPPDKDLIAEEYQT